MSSLSDPTYTDQTSTAERTPTKKVEVQNALRSTRRITVGLGLATIAAIHVLDLPGKFAETPYLAYLYIALIVGSIVIMERLFVLGSRLDFLGAAILSALALAGYAINRTVGMPDATGDIGNWLEPLGLLSIVVELFVIWQALAAYFGRSRL